MRFGYWMPIFGGWLRNVEDEGMAADWSYVKALAVESEAATAASAQTVCGTRCRSRFTR